MNIIFLRLYLSRISANDDVNEDVLARGTTGFTGAEIENMINQAALKAAGDGYMKVTMAHMEEAKDRIMMGEFCFNFKIGPLLFTVMFCKFALIKITHFL